MSAIVTAVAIMRIPTETGMQLLRSMFPNAEADYMNFVIFSTSGVHGAYTTIEDIEHELVQGKAEAAHLTVLVVQPRTVCLHYGHIFVELSDLPFLKNLRTSSSAVMAELNQTERI